MGLHKYGAVSPVGIQLESNLTKLSLDLEWFVFSLVKFINLIIKQARVLQENGSVSPVGIEADQIKLGFRVFFISLSNILLLLLNKRGYCIKMMPFHRLESNQTNLCLDLECFLSSLVK